MTNHIQDKVLSNRACFWVQEEFSEKTMVYNSRNDLENKQNQFKVSKIETYYYNNIKVTQPLLTKQMMFFIKITVKI